MTAVLTDVAIVYKSEAIRSVLTQLHLVAPPRVRSAKISSTA
jgi:hypothetical protein